jgi:molybdopterin biosynthesis enzyme
VPFGGETVHYREPDKDETVARRYLMASAELIFPLSAATLPAAPAGPRDDLEDRAREAVRVLTGAMNDVVAPVIEILEQS